MSEKEAALKEKREALRALVRTAIIDGLKCANMSENDLSRRTGIVGPTINRQLSGEIQSLPFDTVVIMCEALNIPIPNPWEMPASKAPVSFHIAAEKGDFLTFAPPPPRRKFIHVLPHLSDKIIGQVMDDSASPLYPKGSTIFMDAIQDLRIIHPRHHVVVKFLAHDFISQIRIMAVHAHPDPALAILYSVSGPENPCPSLMVDRFSLKNISSGQNIEIIGNITTAII